MTREEFTVRTDPAPLTATAAASFRAPPMSDTFTITERERGDLLSGLAFLAMHHKQHESEAVSEAEGARSKRVAADCRRIAIHHRGVLHEVGELTAKFGGRNAYPRPAAVAPLVADATGQGGPSERRCIASSLKAVVSE